MMPKISVVVITKNAAKHLKRCLESASQIADEIIVIDSGSSDNTLEIARKFSKKIINQNWLGYGKQKNIGIHLAKNNWILSLDADEILSQELIKNIQKADFDSYSGFKIPFKNFFAGQWVRYCGWYPDWHLRLFRKDKMKFNDKAVHEYIKPSGKIGKLSGAVIHYSYDSDQHYFAKIDGYTTLDAQYLFLVKRPWTIFYQLGKPLKEFWQCYITQGGILGGYLGLKISLYNSYYRYLVAKKLKKLYQGEYLSNQTAPKIKIGQKISAVIIARDAAKHLAECLEHLSWADEIILVDSGSRDKTLTIAKKYQAKIFSQKWLGYARQKNFAISRAKNNWVLSIDADEIVDSKLIEAIGKIDFKKYNGFYIARKNYFGQHWVRYCGWYPDWQLRLFKKDTLSFEEKIVHEQVKPKGLVGYISGHIIHYTYQNNREYFSKIKNYTDLDAQILFDKNRKWSLFYQLGKPFKEFINMYFTKKGFLDGLLGLKICLFSAYYRWLVINKLRKIEKIN
ncbi:MAG: glycosyltransferase family 2 protein [Patescibacteria group bacterium]|nr:glycosyltransferase family 2 protein [Patescibacteria group bacterium]